MQKSPYLYRTIFNNTNCREKKISKYLISSSIILPVVKKFKKKVLCPYNLEEIRIRIQIFGTEGLKSFNKNSSGSDLIPESGSKTLSRPHLLPSCKIKFCPNEYHAHCT